MSINHEALDAIRRKSLPGLLAAIEAGAQLGPVWGRRETLLMLAAREGSAEAIEALLPLSDARATNDKGETALIIAAGRGRPEGVRALLPHSDPAAQRHDGVDALMVAFREAGVAGWRARLACVELLAPLCDASRPQGLDAEGKPGFSALRRATLRSQSSPEMFEALGPLWPMSPEAQIALSQWGEEALPRTLAARERELLKAAANASQSAASGAIGRPGEAPQGKPQDKKAPRRV